ncbi:MAG: LPXTG cell wall anchor domain-containing protein, partial [Clostridiales bacterium]|nr:LPXTG cell wall anchor domain-containing protein [Clostridiales bacterium]
TAGYELPDTGGSGTRGFRLTGTVMIAGVLLLYGYSQRRRRKGAC